MGIKTNLQAFLDPEFGGYVGYPSTPSQAADEWTNAIQPEIVTYLAPGAAAGFIDGGSSNFMLVGPDFIGSLLDPLPLPDAIDRLMEDVAGEMTDLADADGKTPITPPPAPLDSYNTIFDPEKVLLPVEICQRAEDRILEWLGTGMYTAFYVAPGTPPSGFVGLLGTPWGTEPPEPDDLDKDEDGVKIPDDSDDEDPDVS